MRYQFVLFTLLTAILYTMTACNNSTNPRMQAPPEIFQAIDIEAGKTSSISEPKVDILFVVDNSGSMKAHQETLKANIGVFADKFFNNPRIDYKIGVVPVYDRRYLNDKKVYGTSGVRKMNPYGELVSLKDKNGQIIDAAPYITRDTQDAKNVLKNTVALGVQWGPEAEESFSPVLKIISDEQLNVTKNAGFYDKDAYLVVIFLTDADDATPEMTASTFYEELVQAKGGDRSKVLIAAALPSAKTNSANCSLDGNGPQYQFPDLIAISGALVADLCSNSFGQKLAEFGDRLVQRVGMQRINLGFTPDTNIKLSYGTKDMTEDQRQPIANNKNGYLFDPEHNQIVISPTLNVKRVAGGEIFITATPVNMNNLKNGRAKPSEPTLAQMAAEAKASAKK